MAIIHIEGEYTCTGSDPNSMDRGMAIIHIEGEYTCTGFDTTAWLGPQISSELKVSTPVLALTPTAWIEA